MSWEHWIETNGGRTEREAISPKREIESRRAGRADLRTVSKHETQLSRGERLLLTKIAALSNPKCFASNAYLAEQIGRSERTVRRYLARLVALGEVAVQYRGPKRLIWIDEKDGQIGHVLVENQPQSEPAMSVLQGQRDHVTWSERPGYPDNPATNKEIKMIETNSEDEDLKSVHLPSGWVNPVSLMPDVGRAARPKPKQYVPPPDRDEDRAEFVAELKRALGL